MRYIGLDFGEKSIGAAISDPENKIALGIETIWREAPEALRASVNRLGELIRKYNVTEIVLGYPKNMDNTLSERCAATVGFKEKLERNFKRIPVVLWDERLSTAAVSRTYEHKKGGNKSGNNKTAGKSGGGHYERHVDEMAAVYILQGYLDFKNIKTEVVMNEEQEIITMFDDEGDEVKFHVLSAKEKSGNSFMMVEEVIPEDADEEEEFADVLFFKGLPAKDEDEEITFELVDDEHEDFESVMEMFKKEIEDFEIEMDNVLDFEDVDLE